MVEDNKKLKVPFRRRVLWLLLALSLGLYLIRSTAFWNALSPITQKSLLYELGGTYKIDPLILAAIIRSESHFNPFAESPAGAVGLMQLLPQTAQEQADELKLDYQNTDDLYRPDINLRLGVHYFSKLLAAFNGNLVLAVAAYNAGLSKVKSWHLVTYGRDQEAIIEDIPLEETQQYVRRVFSTYRYFKMMQKIKRFLQGTE